MKNLLKCYNAEREKCRECALIAINKKVSGQDIINNDCDFFDKIPEKFLLATPQQASGDGESGQRCKKDSAINKYLDKINTKINSSYVLYHYSNNDLPSIQPKFFGLNHYSTNEKNAASMPRSFFYTKPEPEISLRGSRYLYICAVRTRDIYDLSTDKSSYLIKSKGNINQALKSIKKNGYKGIKYNLGHDVICLFYNTKILTRIEV